MKHHNIIVISCLLLSWTYKSEGIGEIRDFLQANVVGLPVIHKTVEYPIDPDVGIKRRKLFAEVHGHLGYKLIERLGLGIDGNDERRLAQQQQRDAGHLGGLNYFQP